MSDKIEAIWSISLDCDCQSCGECVDLLDGDDFLSGRDFAAQESCTGETRDVGVWCPKCGHEFVVDFEY
ncbi:MAG: hypothetical protein WC055_00745 [Melioribacteraceae bacterium]